VSGPEPIVLALDPALFRLVKLLLAAYAADILLSALVGLIRRKS